MHALSHRLMLSLLGILTLLVCVAPPTLQLWQFEREVLQPAALRAPLSLLPSAPQIDLNQDGEPERVELTGEQVYIYAQIDNSVPLWQSPPEWQVKQVLTGDLNRDGSPELALLVWRPFKPWPIDSYLPHGGRIAAHQDRRGLSCHLILIGWQTGRFGELWAGSALAQPLRAITAVDLDGDGRQELAVLETLYNTPSFLPARALAVWEWNGFGFSLLARTQGSFQRITVVQAGDGERYLLVQ
jgi:hypothetical protein